MRRIAPCVVSSLKDISISNCGNITAEGLAAVCGALVKLQALNLSRCDSITERGLMGLAALSCLHSLDLSYCTQLTDAALTCIISALTHQLKVLIVISCNLITSSSLLHIATMTCLQRLDLSHCPVTDDDLTHLAALSSLQALSLGGCSDITNSGVERIAKLTLLHTLDLSFCKKITDAARVCDVTDVGLAGIASSAHKLQELNLIMCDTVTDVVLKKGRSVSEPTGASPCFLQNNGCWACERRRVVSSSLTESFMLRSDHRSWSCNCGHIIAAPAHVGPWRVHSDH